MLDVIKTITIEVISPRRQDPGEIEAIESKSPTVFHTLSCKEYAKYLYWVRKLKNQTDNG